MSDTSEILSVTLYGRVSHGERQRRMSLDEQRRKLREEAQAQGYYIASERFEPLNTKGNVPLGQRPEGRELIQEARDGKIQAVMVVYIDRFGRTLLEGLQTAQMLQELGVGIISLNEGINTLDPHSDPINLQLRLMIAEAEHRRIRERLEAGKARAARDNPTIPLGGPLPMGYRLNLKGEYVPFEPEATLVREAYRRIARGEVQRRVWEWAVAYAQEHGIVNGLRWQRRGSLEVRYSKVGKTWYPSSFHKLLRNPVYRGERHYGEYVFQVPALVDEETWERVQQRLDHNAERFGKTSFNNPENGLLSGLLVCGTCGGRMYHQTINGRRYYRCVNYGRRTNKCLGKMPRIEDLDGEVWGYLEDLLRNPSRMLQEIERSSRSFDEAVQAVTQSEAEIVDQLEAVRRDVDALWAMATQQGWELADIAPRLNHLKQRREALETERRRVVQSRAAGHVQRRELEHASKLLQQIQAKLDRGLTPQERYDLVRNFVRKGTVYTIVREPRKRWARKDFRAEIELVWDPRGDPPLDPDAGESDDSGGTGAPIVAEYLTSHGKHEQHYSTRTWTIAVTPSVVRSGRHVRRMKHDRGSTGGVQQ